MHGDPALLLRDDSSNRQLSHQTDQRLSLSFQALSLLAVKLQVPLRQEWLCRAQRPHMEDLQAKNLNAAKEQRLVAIINSISRTIDIPIEKGKIKDVIQLADQSAVLTMEDGSDLVVVKSIEEVTEEVLTCLRDDLGPADASWLLLMMKLIITGLVQADLYDAMARTVVKQFVGRLSLVSWAEVGAIEARLARESPMLQDRDLDPSGCHSVMRYLRVTLAALGGGGLMLYTGSVAAPSIAASLISLFAPGGVAAQMSAQAAAVLTYCGISSNTLISSLCAAAGMGLTGFKMSRRTQGLTQFHFRPLFPQEFVQGSRRVFHQSADLHDGSYGHQGLGLPVFVLIPGWFEEHQDPALVWGGGGVTVQRNFGGCAEGSEERASATAPNGVQEHTLTMADTTEDSGLQNDWEVVETSTSGWWRECIPSGEEHILVWETPLLKRLHRGIKDFMWNQAAKFAWDRFVKQGALAPLSTAAALPLTILQAARHLDDPWQVAILHAEEAGKLLATVLVSRPHGQRPVTLVGFSIGARVLFHCLEELASSGEAGFGIVENAVLLGAPVVRCARRWRAARSVVAGRLINGYSSEDWVLAYLWRTNAWEVGLAGLGPVDLGREAKGFDVENLDLRTLVKGHLQYPTALPNIMAKLRLEN